MLKISTQLNKPFLKNKFSKIKNPKKKKMDKLEYRAVIKHFFKKGFTTKQIKEELDLVHGDSAPCFATVHNWVRRFKAGQESLEDDPDVGRPKTAVTDESINLVEKIVLSDRRLKVKEIAEVSGLSYGTIFNILHDHLNMRKINERWEKSSRKMKS